MVTAGQETTVERFDFGAGRWNEPGEFVLTGRFADGSVETRTISFSNRDLVTLELNWENIVSFDLSAAGGVNNAYFAVDNFVFDPLEDEAPLLAATRADGVAERSGARAASGTRLALTRGTPSGLFNEVEARVRASLISDLRQEDARL